MDKQIEKILEDIFKKTKAESMFLYGSRARTDYKKDSDYEIGILYKKENKVSRSEIAKLHDFENVNIYPFVVEELKKYNLDTPFPKAIYLRELIGSAKTLFGKNILEKMELPEISLIDLVERAGFDLATGFAAIRSFRNNDLISTSLNLKSTLFGVRVLEILELKKFVYTYDEIFKLSKDLKLDRKYRNLIEHVYGVRQGQKIEKKYLFINISFLNQVVLKRIREELYKNKEKVILPRKRIEIK